MQSFEYEIQDEHGIHARPAGQLAKIAKDFDSELTITKESKTVSLKKLMALMGMCVKKGDRVTVSAVGSDERKAIDSLKSFIEENL